VATPAAAGDGEPAARAAGRSMYETARQALANYDDAVAEGRDDDRVLYALRMVAIVRSICAAIDESGGWALLVTMQEGNRLVGTFETEADAAQWAADRLTPSTPHEVLPIDVKAVQRYIDVRW